MRYYDIQVGSGTAVTRWTSFVNGQTDPGALLIELDAPVTSFASPVSNISLRIWGVSLQTISSASDFNSDLNATPPKAVPITISAGMKPGLPLASAAPPAGVIFSGSILAAFGNWIDTNQYVEFVITTDLNVSNLNNITLDWKQGQTLASAIATTLSGSPATSKYKPNIKISDKLVLGSDDQAVFPDIFTFAQHVRSVSQSIGGEGYAGVDLFLSDGVFNVFDGTSPTVSKAINFYDMIGQPTWIGPAQMQFNSVMRADLAVGDYISMPKGLYTLTAAAQTQALKYKSAFQGDFRIDQLRHVGNSRDPRAEAWITTVNCSPAATNPVFANG